MQRRRLPLLMIQHAPSGRHKTGSLSHRLFPGRFLNTTSHKQSNSQYCGIQRCSRLLCSCTGVLGLGSLKYSKIHLMMAGGIDPGDEGNLQDLWGPEELPSSRLVWKDVLEIEVRMTYHKPWGHTNNNHEHETFTTIPGYTNAPPLSTKTVTTEVVPPEILNCNFLIENLAGIPGYLERQ